MKDGKMHNFYELNKKYLLLSYKMPIAILEKICYTVNEEKEDGPMG